MPLGPTGWLRARVSSSGRCTRFIGSWRTSSTPAYGSPSSSPSARRRTPPPSSAPWRVDVDDVGRRRRRGVGLGAGRLLHHRRGRVRRRRRGRRGRGRRRRRRGGRARGGGCHGGRRAGSQRPRAARRHVHSSGGGRGRQKPGGGKNRSGSGAAAPSAIMCGGGVVMNMPAASVPRCRRGADNSPCVSALHGGFGVAAGRGPLGGVCDGARFFARFPIARSSCCRPVAGRSACPASPNELGRAPSLSASNHRNHSRSARALAATRSLSGRPPHTPHPNSPCPSSPSARPGRDGGQQLYGGGVQLARWALDFPGSPARIKASIREARRRARGTAAGRSSR